MANNVQVFMKVGKLDGKDAEGNKTFREIVDIALWGETIQSTMKRCKEYVGSAFVVFPHAVKELNHRTMQYEMRKLSETDQKQIAAISKHFG